MKLLDPFIAGLLFTIGLAFVLSAFGVDVRNWSLDEIGKAGIAGIFFFYGLKLDPKTLRSDLSNWKLHLITQLSTFVLFPSFVLCFYFFVSGTYLLELWFALFFLACLPSTVSSSVVMVSIAKGNIPSAIFNASISGLIGVVVTPVLLGLFINNSGGQMGYLHTLEGVSLQVLFPVFVGLILRPYLGAWIDRHKKSLSVFDKLIILLIVFKSFSSSFRENVFYSVGLLKTLLIVIISITLFFCVFFLLKLISHRFQFSRRDETVLLFCGSKKSLIHGSVFLNLLFADSASAGLILLPTMVYHAFQLIAVSYIAQWRSKEVLLKM